MHGGGKTFQFAHQLGLLKVAKQEIEIHVIQLQVHVGGYKARKIMIVVLLVNVEQLLVKPFDNCKTVLRNQILKLVFGIFHLVNITNIVVINEITLKRIVVQLLQLLLASLDFLNKLFLLGSIFHNHRIFPRLLDSEVKIPCRSTVNMSQKGIREAKALLSCKDVAQNTQVGKVQLRNVHVQVNIVLHIFNIDMATRNISRQIAVKRHFRSIWIFRFCRSFVSSCFTIFVFTGLASKKQHQNSNHHA